MPLGLLEQIPLRALTRRGVTPTVP